MKDQHKDIWLLSDQVIADLAKPIAEQDKARAFYHGEPISSRNELCVTDNLIIHEYESGKMELVLVSVVNGERTLIKTLVNR
ncbi:hypothetical protein NAF17_13180 [Mucilaginibacter sp. RB4R14]|uniref:hypothetical protein n=1 Tax=Mucilaginibacter aurantiaciroseus TaxID=2949308 RepID=UPI002090B4EB|nr:hypothetical protein [Mucilaginibacter aurantiaciroseus]MCO5936493.1 hypothetical protein [Mucilaginibacter aurantiaciroseus]